MYEKPLVVPMAAVAKKKFVASRLHSEICRFGIVVVSWLALLELQINF